MITAVALTGYAFLVGTVAPHFLARARWPHRAPAVAVLAWQGLMVTFVVSAALAVYHIVLAEQHVHDGVVGLLSACGLAADAPGGASEPTLFDVVALLAPTAIVLLPVGWLVRTFWIARRERRLHLDMLTLVGRPSPEYGATIVEHAVPAVYCLPGRARRTVVTQGALDALNDEQLRAVLEHEQAHIVGRHHMLQMAAKSFARAFVKLPLARHAQDQTALLIEMIADDRALRFHSRDALATAMCEVAAGRAPQTALGAGGPSALIRLRRVLTPQPKPHRATWLGLVLASVGTPLLPLLLACGPV